MIQRFESNTKGRDFIVGDIHGCFTKLEDGLKDLSFNEEVDRLFSVGDLVDRGLQSEKSLDYLNKPWFHAVRGNHEQMAIDVFYAQFDLGCYLSNGGAWFISLPREQQKEYVDAFKKMPIVIEIGGKVGIIHAECPVEDWNELPEALNSEYALNTALWARSRINGSTDKPIANIDLLVVGHTPLEEVVKSGNVLYIDTGAVFGRELTIIEV